MKCFSLVRAAAVALATLGMMIPNAPVMAAGQSRVQVKTVDAKIFDIAMHNGAFKGRVVDHTGAAVEGAAITVKQNNKEVARSVTDKSGSFGSRGEVNSAPANVPLDHFTTATSVRPL